MLPCPPAVRSRACGRCKGRPAGERSSVPTTLAPPLAPTRRRFAPRVRELLQRRAEVQARFDAGQLPDFLPDTKHVSGTMPALQGLAGTVQREGAGGGRRQGCAVSRPGLAPERHHRMQRLPHH